MTTITYHPAVYRAAPSRAPQMAQNPAKLARLGTAIELGLFFVFAGFAAYLLNQAF